MASLLQLTFVLLWCSNNDNEALHLVHYAVMHVARKQFESRVIYYRHTQYIHVRMYVIALFIHVTVM